jgi:hypothetical protein
MDIAYHDEDFNREHKDVLENIRVDHPAKVQMDTAWVYAQVAADEYQNGDLENAAAVSEHRLEEITSHLEQNRLLFSI